MRRRETIRSSGSVTRVGKLGFGPLAGVVFCLILLGGSFAHASVAVLLEQPFGRIGAINPTGHSALYFDHICADTPVHLRACGPGETGVVISRYNGIGTLDWLAVPLVPYLYGVENARDIPTSMDRLTALRLRDLYRRQHLESIAPDTETGGIPQGKWYELIGSAFDRTIYGFQVNTTADQDARIIAMFNDRPNVTHFNGAFRNCADFVRSTINQLYPHAIRRNYVADFGLMTPKAVAHSLSRYASKHPETDLQVFQIRQVAGVLPRSIGVEGVTESMLKRYGAPIAVLSPQFAAMVLVAYLGRGRFAVPKDAPELNIAALQRVEAGEPTPLTTSGRTWNFEETVRDESEGYFRGKAVAETAPAIPGGSFPARIPAVETQSASFEPSCAECGGLPSFR